jgi:hypothetical protein
VGPDVFAPVSCLARDWAATKVAQKARGALVGSWSALRSGDGPSPPRPRRRRLLPRRKPREQPRTDRRRPRGPDGVLPPSPARRAPVRLAHPRQLPDGKPLPPRPGNTRPQPGQGNARPERRLRPRLQRAARAEESRFRAPLLVKVDRIRGAVRGHARVRPPQSGPSRLRPPARRLELGVGSHCPSDRFARCLTTPTS